VRPRACPPTLLARGWCRLSAGGAAGALLACGLALLGACQRDGEGRAELRVRRAVLQREVEGLREMAAASRNGLAIPPDDVAIAIEDTLVRDLIAAQLPFDTDVERFHVSLKEVVVQFRGRPLVGLRGSGFVRERPTVAAALDVHGALEDIRVDPSNGTLRAKIAVDEITIEKAGGLESLLSGATLRQLAHTLRLRLESQLPPIEIPVKVQQSVVLPAISSGPVRIEGAAMPLEVGVSRVFAGRGRLWIAVSVRPGDLVRNGGATATPRSAP
jgi:hypothetical protein